jgi:predicted nuclease of predicted toxin-antitoxin system
LKFLLDHDVPEEVAQLLSYWGHDLQKLRDALPITTPDEAVLAHARANGRVIVSCNRNHFLALAQRAAEQHQSFPGLIILIRRRTRQAECAHLFALLRRAGEAGLAANINFA